MTRSGARSRRIVIGLGNRLRGDDAVGLEVARRVRARAAESGVVVFEHDEDALELLATWEGAELAVIVDATMASEHPGTIHRFEAGGGGTLPTALSRTSTHAFGLHEALAMAATLERLPAHVVIYTVDGASFAHGDGLSPRVDRAADAVADRILGELRAVESAPPSLPQRRSSRSWWRRRRPWFGSFRKSHA